MVKVSVIIPTYNAEKTIRMTVDSILNQSFKDFEIVICDDVSTDNTFAILKEIEYSHENIKVYQNDKNSKSAFTRNFAISKSIGEYIMQIDDDDYSSEDRMEKQVKFLDDNTEYDFVGSNCCLWDQSGCYGEIIKVEKPTKVDFLKTSPFLNPSTMLRKSSLEKVFGYRVSSETIRGQDYDLYMRMYAFGMKGYNIQENLLYYYKDNNYYNKISAKNRIGEFKFRLRNFKNMGLLPRYSIYAFKPLLAIIIPNKILNFVSKEKQERLH